MSDPTFEYIIRLPFVPRPVNPEWLGSKFLATLDALTRIDPNIFPDWEIGDLPAMKGYPLAAARSRIAGITLRFWSPSRRDFRPVRPGNHRDAKIGSCPLTVCSGTFSPLGRAFVCLINGP